MAKIVQNRCLHKPENGRSLDKLAQLSPLPENGLKILTKRAKAKYFTNAYTRPLAALKSPLQKSYNNTTYGCSNELKQSENTLTGNYCNNRWCVVCNRIRTAKMINGYKEPLDNLKDKYFVTLTIPNVPENQLKESIQGMIYNFQKIRKCFHKHKIPFVGLRKLECTYNPRRNDFHPHFHILVDGKQAAERLISEWLQRYTQAKRISQDLRKADEGAILEMFKYFSKIVTNKVVYVAALDTIFQAMYKLRVYQPFGIRKVSEDIENIDSQVIKDLKTQETVWNWIENDWVDMNSGELLTGYTPDKLMKTITENIIS
jgi:hypothetical protein